MRPLLYSLVLVWAECAMLRAQGTTGQPPVPAPAPTAADRNAPEMATRDEPTAFQAKVNLVMVRLASEPRVLNSKSLSAPVLELRLKDETMERLSQGVTVRTSIDVKPGTYLIRLVVRDAEERKLSAANGAVQIQ